MKPLTAASAVTEIVLGDEAKLQHFGIQSWGPQAQELFFQRATLGRNAHLLTTVVGLGGNIQKGWIESQIKGTAAKSDILGVVFGTGDQYFGESVAMAADGSELAVGAPAANSVAGAVSPVTRL